jgi:hypothetical protein
VVLNKHDKPLDSLVSEEKEVVDGKKTNAGLNCEGLQEEQLIPNTRFSSRIQD